MTYADISRAAALVSSALEPNQVPALSRVVKAAETIEDIPEPWRARILAAHAELSGATA